jgi:hypothetical protein
VERIAPEPISLQAKDRWMGPLAEEDAARARSASSEISIVLWHCWN